MWPELLENLRFCVSIADTDHERAELRTRIAEVLGERLGEYDEALANYRHVLDAAPGDDAVLAAVRKIGQEHAEFRELAASILIPALNAESRDEELVLAYDMRLSAQTDPEDRAETLREMASVLERRLQRPADAQGALLRSLTERPDSAELHADIERLARVSNGFRDYANALSERAQATFDADLARFLYATLGRINEHELADPAGAIAAYEEAVRQAGDQPELLLALDRLYEKTADYEALVEILERRASVAGTEYEQARAVERQLALSAIAAAGARVLAEPRGRDPRARVVARRQRVLRGGERNPRVGVSHAERHHEARGAVRAAHRARGLERGAARSTSHARPRARGGGG